MAEELTLSSSSSISNGADSINTVFGYVPTQAEASYSLTAFQSYMNNEGPSMMSHNPEFQPVQTAFQFMKTPMVQEMVGSVMCDIGVISAILRNDAVQTFLRSLMLGNSTMRITNGAHCVTPTPQVQGPTSKEHSLVSMILGWLLDNMEIGFMGIFNTSRSFMNSTLESTQNVNTTSTDSSGQFIYMTLLLVVINLLIVFVRRALKQKFKV